MTDEQETIFMNYHRDFGEGSEALDMGFSQDEVIAPFNPSSFQVVLIERDYY